MEDTLFKDSVLVLLKFNSSCAYKNLVFEANSTFNVLFLIRLLIIPLRINL